MRTGPGSVATGVSSERADGDVRTDRPAADRYPDDNGDGDATTDRDIDAASANEYAGPYPDQHRGATNGNQNSNDHACATDRDADVSANCDPDPDGPMLEPIHG
jgi:hypothetical protein